MNVELHVVAQGTIKKKFEDAIDIPSQEYAFDSQLQLSHFQVEQSYLNILPISFKIQQSIQK